MLIDSHCHLLSSEYDDVKKAINDAFKSGVDKIIVNGYDLKSSIEAVELSKEYENLYVAIGIGPENIDSITDEDIKSIKALVNNKKV